MRFLRTITVLAALLFASSAFAEVRLMMVETDSCPWCAKWHKEIGPIYPKTEEGKIAPLLDQDIDDPIPDGITLESSPQYTPTFILLLDGVEVGRIEGYPGEAFFWGMLARLISQLPEEERQLSGS